MTLQYQFFNVKRRESREIATSQTAELSFRTLQTVQRCLPTLRLPSTHIRPSPNNFHFSLCPPSSTAPPHPPSPYSLLCLIALFLPSSLRLPFSTPIFNPRPSAGLLLAAPHLLSHPARLFDDPQGAGIRFERLSAQCDSIYLAFLAAFLERRVEQLRSFIHRGPCPTHTPRSISRIVLYIV